MNNQAIINEAIKLGQAIAGTSEVQAKRLELGLTDEQALVLWTNFHQARDEAYRAPRKRQGLTTEQVARAREIIQAQRNEEFAHLVWKYQARSCYSRSNPVPTSTLRQWAKIGDMRDHHYLRQTLREAGEL